MPDEPINSSKRALDPIDRVTEVLFGLIMVLAFTGSLSVAEAGREDIRTMLVGALGCNLAWGIIDGAFYLLGSLAEKSRNLLTLRAVRDTSDPQKAQHLIADALPWKIPRILRSAEIETLHRRLKELPEPPKHARLGKDDWRGAAAVFLIVFFSTLPVVIPFTFMKNIVLAMRVSNAIAILMLFAAGYSYGRAVGRRPWSTGIYMIVLGLVFVAITIALGG